MRYDLPAHFVQTTKDLYGGRGIAWLDAFPSLIAGLEERWQIQVQPPFELSYNYVAPAVRTDGSHAVLKVGVPNSEMFSEMSALSHYDGRGIVRLLECNRESGAMLLERIEPGKELALIEDDDTATRIAAEVMQKLWIPAPADSEGILCTAEKWNQGLDRLRLTFSGSTGPFPAPLVELAERIHASFRASSEPLVLLHGDLHHWNILSAQREPWLALDPKGVIGEPAYEIGPWMFNKRTPGSDKNELKRQARRRLDIFAEVLGLDFQRMLACAFARSVLSAWWTYEDHKSVEYAMFPFSEALAEMI